MARVVQIDGGEPDLDRPRFWGVVFLRNERVLLRHWPIPAHGEDLTERTPQLYLTRTEWAQRHAEFNLAADGTPLTP